MSEEEQSWEKEMTSVSGSERLPPKQQGSRAERQLGVGLYSVRGEYEDDR